MTPNFDKTKCMAQTENQDFTALAAGFGDEFMSYNPDRAQERIFRPDSTPVRRNEARRPEEISDWLDFYRRAFADDIKRILAGEVQSTTFPDWITEVVSAEEIRALEARGIVFAGLNQAHPRGGIFINDQFKSGLGLKGPENVRRQAVDAIYATGVLQGVTGLHPRPAAAGPSENVKGLVKIPVNSLVAAVYKDGQWSQSHVFPDGNWMVDGFDNTTAQYAESAFEGMVAMEGVLHDGKFTIFRPEENARRFMLSCQQISVPPISVSQFVASVQEAVKNNSDFISKNGKLYVRPFVMGLRGGTGIHPAKQFLFAVEVTPYGDYMAVDKTVEDAPVGVAIQCVTFKRPVFGKRKVSSNYAPLIPMRVKVQSEGFADIVLVTEDGFLQECASNNFFLVEKQKERSFLVKTPPLTENILPGITRKSLLEIMADPSIQRRLGVQIEIQNDQQIPEKEILNASGAFGSGTAVGIANMQRIRLCDGQQVEFKDMDTYKLIIALKTLLIDLRRGAVPGYEHWVMEVE